MGTSVIGTCTGVTFTIRIKHHILNYLVLENASRICQSEMHLKNARRSTKFSIFSPHMASCFLVSTTTVLRFAQCKYAFLNALKYFYDMSQQLSRICYENWEHYKTALSNMSLRFAFLKLQWTWIFIKDYLISLVAVVGFRCKQVKFSTLRPIALNWIITIMSSLAILISIWPLIWIPNRALEVI